MCQKIACHALNHQFISINKVNESWKYSFWPTIVIFLILLFLYRYICLCYEIICKFEIFIIFFWFWSYFNFEIYKQMSACLRIKCNKIQHKLSWNKIYYPPTHFCSGLLGCFYLTWSEICMGKGIQYGFIYSIQASN